MTHQICTKCNIHIGHFKWLYAAGMLRTLEGLLQAYKYPIEAVRAPVSEDGICYRCLHSTEEVSPMFQFLLDNNERVTYNAPDAEIEVQLVAEDLSVISEITVNPVGLLSFLKGSGIGKDTYRKINVKNPLGKWVEVIGVYNPIEEFSTVGDNESEKNQLANALLNEEGTIPPQIQLINFAKTVDTEQYSIGYPDGEFTEVSSKENSKEHVSTISGRPVTSSAEQKEMTSSPFISRPLHATWLGKIPPFQDLAIVNIVTALNGIFEVRPVGSYILVKQVSNEGWQSPLADGEILRDGIYSGLPLIPLKILTATVKFFQQVLEKMGTEAVVKIFYMHESKKFMMWIPFQVVKETTVSWAYEGKNKVELDSFREKNYEWIMDIHSHAGMPAYFSSGAVGTDDHDEKNDGMYGVIGNVETSSPTMQFRLRIGNEFFNIDPSELFNFCDCDVDFSADINLRLAATTTSLVAKSSQTNLATIPVPVGKQIAIFGEPIASGSVSKGEKKKLQPGKTYIVKFTNGASAEFSYDQMVRTAGGILISFYNAYDVGASIEVPNLGCYAAVAHILEKVPLETTLETVETKFPTTGLSTRSHRRNSKWQQAPAREATHKLVDQAFKDTALRFVEALEKSTISKDNLTQINNLLTEKPKVELVELVLAGNDKLIDEGEALAEKQL